jgi:sodium/potassium-transporting ATPase subunit beta
LSFSDQLFSLLFFDQTAKILLFYIIFYAALSGFFAAMLAVFYQTLHPKMPKWKLEESIIGTNPGE